MLGWEAVMLICQQLLKATQLRYASGCCWVLPASARCWVLLASLQTGLLVYLGCLEFLPVSALQYIEADVCDAVLLYCCLVCSYCLLGCSWSVFGCYAIWCMGWRWFAITLSCSCWFGAHSVALLCLIVRWFGAYSVVLLCLIVWLDFWVHPFCCFLLVFVFLHWSFTN